MKENIESYKELLEYQQQLKTLVEAKKNLVRSDVELLRAQTKPLSDVFGMLKNSEAKQRFLAVGLGMVAKTAFQKILMMKAGRLVRFIAPYIAENPGSDLKKLFEKFTNRVSAILTKSPIEAAGAAEDDHQPRENPQ